MKIALFNDTPVPDIEVQAGIRAINQQLKLDFKPFWDIDAELVLMHPPEPQWIEMGHPWAQADGVIYLMDEVIIPGALGAHTTTLFRGLPEGYVFREFSEQLGESWEATLSHEVLEMVLDPHVNRLALGAHPDPAQGGRGVLHWYEACDAVQGRNYQIDGVSVSDFVLPLYFTPIEERGGRTAFMGEGPTSFGVTPGDTWDSSIPRRASMPPTLPPPRGKPCWKPRPL